MNIQMQADGTPLVLLTGADWAEVVPELADAWPVLCRALADYVRWRQGHAWDRVRLYARFESGVVWVSPDAALPESAAVACGLRLALVEQVYNELPDADEPDFDRRHEQMANALFEALRESSAVPAARAALGELLRGAGVPVTFVEYDDLETERLLVDPVELSEAA